MEPTSENPLYAKCQAELRASVCSHCIEHHPAGPPCTPLGKTCGIEVHIPELVEICSTVHSTQMEPYINELHDKICSTCTNKDGPTCPCPLDYLLLLAVEAVDRVLERNGWKSVEV